MNSPRPAQTTRAQGVRFVFFGAFNTAVTYLAYCLLVFVLQPQVAYAIVFALGMVIAYVGNSRFVFGKPLDWKVAGVYPLVYLAQYLLTAALIHLFGLWFGLGPRLALALSLVLATPTSFYLNRFMLNKVRRKLGA